MRGGQTVRCRVGELIGHARLVDRSCSRRQEARASRIRTEGTANRGTRRLRRGVREPVQVQRPGKGRPGRVQLRHPLSSSMMRLALVSPWHHTQLITMAVFVADCDDGLMTPMEDPRTHASRFLETCRAALKLQYQRVLDLAEPPKDTMEWQVLEPDCYLLVLAIRQAIVGVEAVAHFEGGSIKNDVDQAIAEMARAHVDIRDLRNMLTHFDSYLKGDGVQQRRIPDPDFYVHRKWRSSHSGEVLLWIRASYNAGEPLKSVEVLSASRWVMDLIDEVREVVVPRPGTTA